jgi:hypothetical protein
VIDYSNPNFVDCIDTRKFTSEYIFLLDGRVVSWRNTKQIIVTLSLHAIK